MITSAISDTISRTHPGIRFETVAPPLAQAAMPRMDVAAFVGFAERGPLHWPVAIEDMAQFEKVFGGTLKLGWDESGERVLGHLAESVRAFFLQGGRRCWVVRVAGASATSNVFALPGLCLASHGENSVLPAYVRARSDGSWSDRFRVATRLHAKPIQFGSFACGTGPARSWELRTRSDMVLPGDLVRIVEKSGKKQAFLPVLDVKCNAASGETTLYARTIAFFAKGTKDGREIWERAGTDTPLELEGIRASIVSIDLRVQDSDPEAPAKKRAEWRMENLGLTPMHPRYCGALPTDIEVHRGPAHKNGAPAQSLSPRPFADPGFWFPLAGMAVSDEDEPSSFMVPLDLDENFGAESAPVNSSLSQLERDGLSSFDTSLFLDPALRDARTADLMAIAHAVRYAADKYRPLQGIHSLLGFFGSTIQDEVTLVAVPDALHAPWSEKPKPASYGWVSRKVVQQEKEVAQQAFVCCRQLPAPANLEIQETPDSMIQLAWTVDETGEQALNYQVQESATGDFTVVDREWHISEKALDIAIPAPGQRVFRVRAQTATKTSEWSLAIALQVEETRPDIKASSTDEVAREVQCALVRMCAAHGEMFPVLSLPRDATLLDAATRTQALSSSDSQAANANLIYLGTEGRIGSYAAVYHPWLVCRDMKGRIRSLPPDGAVLGMIATRSRDRGAWVAPANQPLRGVAALHSSLSASLQEGFMNTGINLVLQRPEGYTLMSEDTLSSAPDLRPIHVRRLLILLRRMALRMGEEFIFEPNNQALRDMIRQRCNSMLERLFRAGAFAGRSASESFQVSVDDADNPPASVDAGRLMVRIRVRPAQALRFITVRFTLGGGANAVIEERAA